MDNQETSKLEENLPMVNYIMLHRIYDLLTVISMKVNPEDTKKMVKYHEEGHLLGPMPSYISE
jgi:hypothetical protein